MFRSWLLALPIVATDPAQAQSVFTGNKAKSEDDGMTLQVLKSTERKDRVIDMAAVAIQQEAIARIEELAKNPIHKGKEADLLFQLGIARLEAASIQFRIAHERAHRLGNELNLKTYNDEMAKAIEVLTRFMNSYKKDPRFPEALFLRGTAYQEIKKIDLAEKDFIELIKRFPEVPQTSSAYMSLADFAVEEKNHKLALEYLKPMEKRPQDAHYPFALYKLAWAHFNLDNVRTALDYLGKHIKFYDDIFKKHGELQASEMAIRENSLKDVALFFFEGIQKEMPGFSIQNSFKEFEKYAGTNPSDPMVIRFTALLRARNDARELEQWSEQVFKSHYAPQTRLASLNILFENQHNRRLYSEMGANMARIRSVISSNPELENSESGLELKRIVDASAKDLHKAIQENKRSPLVMKLVGTLEDIYDMLRLLAVQDRSDSVRSFFNLAETYFELGHFGRATEFYVKALNERKLVEKKRKKIDSEEELVTEKALFLRALASRFKELEGKVIPKELKTSALNAASTPKELPAKFSEWSAWIETALKSYKLEKDELLIVRRYEWEAQRTRYAAGQVDSVLGEFARELAKATRLDDIQEPKLALWIDTLVKSEDWASLHELTKKWNRQSLASQTLGTKVKDLESDSFIKQMEKDFADGQEDVVLGKAEECRRSYKEDTQKVLKCQILAAEILAKRKDYKGLLKELNQFRNIEDAKLKARIADLKEEALYAQQEYESLLELFLEEYSSQSKEDTMKVFEATLLVQRPSAYRKTLAHSEYCKNAAEQCRLLRALLELQGEESGFKMSFDDIFKAHKPYRSIYSLASVSSFKSSLVDRMKVMRNAFSTWEAIDPKVYWSVLPLMEAWLETELNTNRELLKRNYPLKSSDPNTLATRFSRVKDFESSLELLSKSVPFSVMKSKILKGAQNSLRDVIAEMKSAFPEESAQFVPALEKKSEALGSQFHEASSEDIADLRRRLEKIAPQIIEADAQKVFKDLKEGRWVAAKMLQDEFRRKGTLSAAADAWLNGHIFLMLNSIVEADVFVAQAEELLQKRLLTKGDIR